MALTKGDIEEVVRAVKAELFNGNPGLVRHTEFQRMERMVYGLYAFVGALFLEVTGVLLALLLKGA